MVGLLLVMAWQNPLPPNVTLPKEWKVHYWGSAGFGSGSLVGPKGEEILFSGYQPTGAMATTTHEAERDSLFISTELDKRTIDVTVREDGYMVVSFPPFGPQQFRNGFDYWTRTKTAQQAATALMIALTRLEVLRDTDRDKEYTDGGWKPTRDYPFTHFGLSGAFTRIDPAKSPAVRYEKRGGGWVEFKDAVPEGSKWEDKATLLGREVRWGEDKSGHAWAAVSDSKAVFVASEAKPQWIVFALLSALNFRRVP